MTAETGTTAPGVRTLVLGCGGEWGCGVVGSGCWSLSLPRDCGRLHFAPQGRHGGCLRPRGVPHLDPLRSDSRPARRRSAARSRDPMEVGAGAWASVTHVLRQCRPCDVLGGDPRLFGVRVGVQYPGGTEGLHFLGRRHFPGEVLVKTWVGVRPQAEQCDRCSLPEAFSPRWPTPNPPCPSSRGRRYPPTSAGLCFTVGTCLLKGGVVLASIMTEGRESREVHGTFHLPPSTRRVRRWAETAGGTERVLWVLTLHVTATPHNVPPCPVAPGQPVAEPSTLDY